MIAQVTITDDGDVTATVDSESHEDEDAARLAGLALDDMLARAAAAAVECWFRLRSEDGCSAE